VSRATLNPDLLYMRDRLHAPIEYDHEANGHRFGKPRTGPGYELPGLWFNATEIHALLTTLHLLTSLQPGLLDGQVQLIVKRLGAAAAITPGGRSKSASASFNRSGAIAAALLKPTRLLIRHYNRREDRETEREVSRRRLVHFRDNWHLDARPATYGRTCAASQSMRFAMLSSGMRRERKSQGPTSTGTWRVDTGSSLAERSNGPH
jgi:predicted DNA-binding transcriptional regulator YafY